VIIMTLVLVSKYVHILLGFFALVGFWGAAMQTKGSSRHKWFGRRYLIVMALLLATTLIMAAGMVVADQGKRATFNVYISLVAATSVWMAWRSIVDRDNVNAFRGFTCKTLCLGLTVYALFLLFVIVPKVELVAVKAMVVAFSVLGLTTSGSLLYRIVRGADHKQWWLSDHLTAMAMNFGATHSSMTILGLSSLVPAVNDPAMRTTILVCWMVVALLLRIWAGKRFMTPARLSRQVTGASEPLFDGSAKPANPT
jgi:hypothetical protein